MLPEFSFIDQSLRCESGLTLFMSITVCMTHSDVMTRYNFPGGFGAVRAQVQQITGQPGPENKDFAHGRIKDTEHQHPSSSDTSFKPSQCFLESQTSNSSKTDPRDAWIRRLLCEIGLICNVLFQLVSVGASD